MSAKIEEKCPECGDPIWKHTLEEAIECANDMEIHSKKIKEDMAYEVGMLYGGLKGRGQRYADRNIITLTFDDGQEDSIEPERLVMQKVLLKQVDTKEKDDGSKKGSVKEAIFGKKDNGDSEGSEPDEESE